MKTTQRFTFDTALHRYCCDGVPLPGVSGIIRRGGYISPEREAFYSEEARWRGTRVHHACLQIDLDAFGGDAYEDDAGYIESYLKWRAMVLPRWTALEEPRYSDRYWFCGTPDRVGFDGRGRPLILDFKTGGKERWHAMQLALYDILCDDLPPRQRRRVTLYLKADGRIAQGVQYSDPTDYDRALGLLKAA